MVSVEELELPGIGRRCTIQLNDGGTLSVIHLLTGRKELYYTPAGEEKPVVIRLGQDEASCVATILQPVTHRQATKEAIMTELSSDTCLGGVRVKAGSRIAGKRIGELDIRRKTGVNIIAVRRGQEVISSPSATEEIRAEDILVAIGSTDNLKRLESLAE